MPDSVELLRDAVGDILAADATLTTTLSAVVREPFTADAADIPVLVFQWAQLGENSWELELAAIAVDSGSTPAMQIAHEMLDAAVDALTYTAFATKSVEVVPHFWRHDTDTTLAAAIDQIVEAANRPSLRVGVRTVPCTLFL